MGFPHFFYSLMDDSRVSHIQTLAEPILGERKMELVELTCRPQGGQLHIRLLVDRAGGVTIQQCAQVNQRLGEALESGQVIEGSYTIEVSSPGLDRPLVIPRDYERAIGENVQVTLATPDGRTKELAGMLLAVQPDAVVIKTAEGNLTVLLRLIRMAKKALRW